MPPGLENDVMGNASGLEALDAALKRVHGCPVEKEKQAVAYY